MASTRVQRKINNPNSGLEKERVPKHAEIPSEIQCKICKKRYENPKLLPCLHTFCKACLEESYEKHGTLYCPSCPGEINSSEYTGIDELPNNFLVSNLLQVIDLNEGTKPKQCESCDEEAQATSRCFECSDFLCASCVEAHHRVRFTKQHRVVAVKNLNVDSLMRAPNCVSHAQESVKMYCKQCKELVCRSCIVHKHNDHILVSLNEAVEDTKPKLNTLLVATRARIPILQRKLKEVHSSKEKLEEKVDDVIKSIQATSARILMAVKRREKDLYRMLRRIHDKKGNELESRETDLQNELAQVLDSCEFTEELVKQENDATLLNAAGIAYTRLRNLGEKDIAPVSEVQDDEIQYTVNDRPILDELKIYGKVTSKEEKAKTTEEERKEGRKDRRSRSTSVRQGQEGRQAGEERESTKKEGVKTSQEDGNRRVERRPSWLETLANPRALLRRLSFGGDESDGRRPEERGNTATSTAPQDKSKDGTEAKPSETKSNETKPSVQENAAKSPEEKDKDKRQVDSANYENTRPDQATKRPESLQGNEDTKNSPAPTQSNPTSPSSPGTSQQQSKSTSSAVYESPKSHSILKHSPQCEEDRGNPSGTLSPNSPDAWTVADSSRPSGAHMLSYLPTLNILTKNRRGRPREVEIQLESPDKSIISAQILDHKNGTYTIFYCPLTPGEHNLYVNVVGKNIRHGKRVLNFYGKFGNMGAEELFLTRRALSCIRWQVTPGFVEIKDKKVVANSDI